MKSKHPPSAMNAEGWGTRRALKICGAALRSADEASAAAPADQGFRSAVGRNFGAFLACVACSKA